MTTPTKSSFFSNEPQVVQGLVLWVLTQIGAILIGHTHLVSSDQWSSLTTALVPVITAAVIGLVTFVWRRWLSPAWKVVQSDINKVPFGPEVEAFIKTEVENYLNNRVPVVAGAEAPVGQVDGSPAVGTPAPGESNGTAHAG